MICGPYLTPDCTQMRIKLKSVYKIWWQQSVLSQLQFCLKGQSTQKWNPAIIHSPSCHSKSVWLSFLSSIVFYIRKTYFEKCVDWPSLHGPKHLFFLYLYDFHLYVEHIRRCFEKYLSCAFFLLFLSMTDKMFTCCFGPHWFSLYGPKILFKI